MLYLFRDPEEGSWFILVIEIKLNISPHVILRE